MSVLPDRPVFLARRHGRDYYIGYAGITWMMGRKGLEQVAGLSTLPRNPRPEAAPKPPPEQKPKPEPRPRTPRTPRPSRARTPCAHCASKLEIARAVAVAIKAGQG